MLGGWRFLKHRSGAQMREREIRGWFGQRWWWSFRSLQRIRWQSLKKNKEKWMQYLQKELRVRKETILNRTLCLCWEEIKHENGWRQNKKFSYKFWGRRILRTQQPYVNFTLKQLTSTPCHWASLVAQTVKNLLAMRETWVPSLGWGDPQEDGIANHSTILAWRIFMNRGAWRAIVHAIKKSQTWLSD